MNILASALMRQASDRLTDQEPDYEYELYTRQQVLDALNWALSAVARYRPEIFHTVKSLPITAGSVRSVAGCDHIVGVLGITTDGVYDDTHNSIERSNRYLRRKQCPQDTYRLSHIGVVGRNEILTFPPVPDNVNVEVSVMCAYTPQADSEETVLDIPLDIRGVIQEFMLYYLYSIDIESVGHRDRANTHFTVATSLLGLVKK